MLLKVLVSALGSAHQSQLLKGRFSKVAWQPLVRFTSTENNIKVSENNIKTVHILGETYLADEITNITPKVLSKVGKCLHNDKYNPLCLIKERIRNYFHANYVRNTGNPMFAVFDTLNPVVSLHQNFESLLTPENHPSRSPSDTYYVSSNWLLRAHTSAHQEELVRSGCDAFLAVGDVYRRDTIDSTHYPVFHQMEGVRLFTESEIFSRATDATGLHMFEDGKRDQDTQEYHTVDSAKLMEFELKHALTGLAHHLFGKDIQYRWVRCYFPFTHPSWELEVRYQDDWLEVLGCGIMEQVLLSNAGAAHKMGWAFGLGLERLAMLLYKIPDIRLFWSEDPGFLNQFKVENPETSITYQAVSQYPPCTNDLSFWIPADYTSNDFYDLVRSIGGDLVQEVTMVDCFTHPKTGRTSHCYRIVYRHMEKTLTQQEVNEVHQDIADSAFRDLGIEVR